MDPLNSKTSTKPVMGVQGLLINSSGNSNPATITTTASNNGNNAIPTFHHSSPIVLNRPPIVITSPSPHGSPSSAPKTVPRVSTVPVTSTSQVSQVTPGQSSVAAVTSVSTSVTSSVTSVTTPVSIRGGSSAPTSLPSTASVTPKATVSAGGVSAHSSPVPASVVPAKPVPASVVPAKPVPASPSVVGVRGTVTPAEKNQQATGPEIDLLSKAAPPEINSSNKPVGSGPSELNNTPSVGRNKSGFVRLDHPIEPVGTTATSSGSGSWSGKKEPVQGSGTSVPTVLPGQRPSNNNQELINQKKNVRNQNLINESGITPQVPSTVTTTSILSTKPVSSPANSIPQPKQPTSGTNPVNKSQHIISKNNSPNPSTILSSGKGAGKMESTSGSSEVTEITGQAVSAQSLAKDVNLNLVADTVPGRNNNGNENLSLINGKDEALKIHESISLEETTVGGDSIPASVSSSETECPSRPVTAPACFNPCSEAKPTIGKDVEALMNMLEQSGLCGPPIPIESQSAPSSRPVTAPSAGSFDKTPTPSRPGTATDKKNNSAGAGDSHEVRTGSAVRKTPGSSRSATVNNNAPGGDQGSALTEPMMKVKAAARSSTSPSSSGKREVSQTTPSKGEMPSTNRPSTGNEKSPKNVTARPPSAPASRSRPSTGHGKSGGDKSGKSPGGNADGSSGKDGGKSTPNSTTTPVEPKLAKNARTSTPRAASARRNTTTTTPTSSSGTKEEESKVGKNRNKSLSIGSGVGLGGSSSSPNTPQSQQRPKSAISASNSAPRSRPSSTLYQHTASSAQKGIQTPSPTPNSVQTTPSPSTPKTSRSSTRPRTATPKMGDPAGGDAKPATLKEQFAVFSRFGDTSSDGKSISLSNCDKWMKQAHVIDAKKITTTDTSICFKKLFKTAKKVSYEDFQKYIEDLAKSKKIEPQVILDKLTSCGAPGLSTATKAAHASVVERLTDTSKYTGSHKERFDASGKGKGIEGRRDVPDGSGYVNSFKTKLDLNKSDSKESSPVPVKVPHSAAQVAKEASPAPE